MIPKKIHYCWLSDDPLPEKIQMCIETWKTIMPDYEIVLWDRKRFDISSVPWVKEAYEQKRYAFCADYIRIYALYTVGGIYLDSDVMVYKPFDPFLCHKSFSSVEFHSYFLYAHIMNKKSRLVGIEAAVLGSEPKCEWLKDVLHYYEGRKFVIKDENIMPRVLARVLHQNYGFEYYPVFQKLENDFYVYPAEIFSTRIDPSLPIKYSTHLGANSWGKKQNSLKSRIRKILNHFHLLLITQKIRGIRHFEKEGFSY